MKTTRGKIKEILKRTEMPRKNIILTTDENLILTLLEGIPASVKMISLTCFDDYDNTLELLKYLEILINNSEIKDKQIISKRIAKTKTTLIYRLRALENSFAKTEKKENFLKDIINRLELLEISIIYSSDKARTIKVSHDLINKIIFEERNLNHSRHLITNYPYMINIYNGGEKILDKVIDRYLELIEKYAKEKGGKKELYYYDNILELLLSEKKIKIDQKDIDKVIDKIKSSLEETTLEGKAKDRMYLWLNHLITVLNDKDYSIDLETANHLYGIRNYFKKSVLDEANLYLLTNRPKPEEIQTETIITIDGDETYNRDDALSISKDAEGTYHLKIIIADPNSYFSNESLIMGEARKRTQSIYHEANNVEMFPNPIVKNHLSLDEGKSRYVRIYSYDIDKYGTILDFKIEKGVRRANYNLTYEQVNNIIKVGEENLSFFKSICLLEELKNILKNRQVKNIILNEASISKSDSYGTSEELIALYMIFNNSQVAKYFKDRNLPFIYRHHESTAKVSDEFIDYDYLSRQDQSKFSHIFEQLEKINQSAEYSMTKSNHDALGLDAYSHTTSPNRRYADICAAECVDMFVFGNPTDKEAYEFEGKLKRDVDYLNARNEEIYEYYKKLSRVRKR